MATPAVLQFRLAHSLLLSRFIHPCVPQLDGDDHQLRPWTIALAETPKSAIERFKQAGFLVRFVPTDPEAVSEALAALYGVSQLKAMLKAKGLTVSGKKDVLIGRLVKADEDGLSKTIASLNLYHCSSTGRDFASTLEKRKEQACAEAINAIEAKDYPAAIHAYQSIEDDLGFPKWEFEGTPQPKLIELIMTVRPKILNGCPEQVLSKLRLAIALQCLSGRHAPKNLLNDVETGIRLDAETASRMIYFLARHTEDMQQWQQMRIAFVTHLATQDSCTVCSDLNGRKWRMDEAPELPHIHCTNEEYGCRCLYQPVID